MSRSLLLLIHLLPLVSAVLVADTIMGQKLHIGTPEIINFSRVDYSGGTQNWAIGQDQRGVVYFGNNKGLLTFDGSEWSLVPVPNQTIVRSFAFGNNEELYLGAQRELGMVEFDKNGRAQYHSFVHMLPAGHQEFEDVWKIFRHGNEVYFCTEKGLFVYADSTMSVVLPPSGRFENFFMVNNNLYVQDKQLGMFKYANQTLELIFSFREFNNDRIVSILSKKEDELVVISASRGIWLYDGKALLPWDTPLAEFAKAHRAYCASLLEDGRIALGTAQNGLVLADSSGAIQIVLNQDTGLQNNTVLSLFEDAQHNLWLGMDNGLAYIELNSPFSFIGSESNLEGTGYTSLERDGFLLLGTNQGLYSAIWPPVDHSGLSFVPISEGIGQVWNIDALSNEILISKHNGAYALRGSDLQQFSDAQGSWKFLELAQHPGYALQGTYNGLVLCQLESSGSRFRWRPVKVLEGFEESSRVIEEDSDGHIWISHAYKGLYKLKLNIPDNAMKASIEKVTSFGSDDGLPGELFLNVAKLRNELVFTTPKGIYRFNRVAGKFEKFTDYEEVFGENRNVHRLIEDGQGNIWFSIDREFGVLHASGFGNGEPMKISYFNQLYNHLVEGFEHVYAIDSANVLIGVTHGFVHFNPLQFARSEFPFSVMIRKVVSIAGVDSVLYSGNFVENGNYIPEFEADMNSFRFEFTAPFFADHKRLQYSYWLEGFDESWSEWNTRTNKEYTNLPYGRYTFKVRARNAFAVESDTVRFTFVILPPWWSTAYAKFGFAVIVVILLLVLVRFVSGREKQKAEAFKQEQTQKMQRKEAEFRLEVERSESELMTLRNEKLQTDINHKTSQLASTTMHLVQKTEMLQKLKNDLVKLTQELPADNRRQLKQITRAIESDMQLDNNWEQFEIYFDQVHENFFKRLRSKHPELTPKDQKLCAYLRMNLTTKEIAPLMNISVRGVEISRYRLRKKLNIENETNLVEFIMDV